MAEVFGMQSDGLVLLQRGPVRTLYTLGCKHSRCAGKIACNILDSAARFVLDGIEK